MDIFDLLLSVGVITATLVFYLILFKRAPKMQGEYREPGWNYSLKYLFARFYVVKRWKKGMRARGDSEVSELPRDGQFEGWDGIRFRTTSTEGDMVLLEIRRLCGHQSLAEVTVHVRLSDGTNYRLPRHPDTVTGTWVNTPDGWSSGGLKIQVLEAKTRLRILYNGLLTRDDGVTQHAQMNLIWASASHVMRYPEDWSDQLAAEALALEPWRDGNWSNLLEKWKEGGWHQWGSAQGRLQLFDGVGVPTRTEYLRTRGLRERRWMPQAQALRRSVSIIALARDGTAVQIRAHSYKNIITQYVFGTVRYPNSVVKTITGTSLHLPDFYEYPGAIPSVFTLNVESAERNLQLVVHPSYDGGRLLTGVPYQHETFYRVAAVGINGEPGYGILELGYLPSDVREPSVVLSSGPSLRWASAEECGEVEQYCVQMHERIAACPQYVGGKAASLALLASVQTAQGYRVPPAFCITVKALETHLQSNPHLNQAIKDIEAANENYNETKFKEKCAKAAELFCKTEITGKLFDDIIKHLNDLRKKAAREDFGPERRFAVRSSAVGEDSETLSAAGQNETVLGCVSDTDVIKGVQKCWASMYAFTSAYYRRQNGQPCMCGGAVVVQALVSAQSAGVMFTRHPAAGDPTRILITANYGLGESVVSGSVEPDTFIISRDQDDSLSISTIELGSKLKRVTVCAEGGVNMEEVPLYERDTACVSNDDILRLAHIGVLQDKLWGAPRDIEWAISKNEIFLLQARPVTSLERWTDEELLHELDSPIMDDDDLTTTANCGEVLPKPVTPLSIDLVLKPLNDGMNRAVSSGMGDYDNSIIVTHNRCMISLYNPININVALMGQRRSLLMESNRMGRKKVVYRRAPANGRVDVNTRMMEMAIHGHKVATDEIIRTAVRRRPPKWYDKIVLMCLLLKYKSNVEVTDSLKLQFLITSKWRMNNTVKIVKEMNVKTEVERPMDILESLWESKRLMGRVAYNHGITSGASTANQLIAMAVLLEGSSDYTPEYCNEICAMFNSGNVLSAEVPWGLAKLTQEIEESGKADQFRKQDPKDAMYWLQKNVPHVHLNVCVFLEQHGHRAIMEFDLATKPWVLVPENLMKILQNLRVSNQEAPTVRSDIEVINSLTLPKKNSTRKILAWVLPLCHRTVRHRETTKAHFILAVHKQRLAAIELGKLLVRQWYLPDHELVFFFSYCELKKYIQTRDPALLRKAIQRRQCYPGWCKLKFAELNTGWIYPLDNVEGERVRTGGVRLEATSVCGGEAVGRACVVRDLSEIDQLQQGDILITYATDIGWSPYFPLLAGIVTELGGLISHGAVIAREYGLPCIVGATHATDLFKTGDIVRLMAAKGIIEKVEVVESKEQNGDSIMIKNDKSETDEDISLFK
ncbi:unnamed protein product [Diatraea saccharalis]|uniref:Phosphoenolpyruvate synthase n=1 Tax=Diatraea saccharalis TaxID=40085 RepID=A0A9N9RGW4_9NEOP|nr:unnamed protein product [Diatraea saccharalis]